MPLKSVCNNRLNMSEHLPRLRKKFRQRPLPVQKLRQRMRMGRKEARSLLRDQVLVKARRS